ncbi:hypothetical protein L1049_015344 [Liquidambar formosana]|uniref:Uncharacterized protein n=1 Tax=Liquidambar formosana TaxID=63359 RepID=A0AAP0S3J2_LIQFO
MEATGVGRAIGFCWLFVLIFQKDVLTNGYNYKQQFSISTNSNIGVAFTSSVVAKQGLPAGTVAARYKYNNTVINVEVSKHSNISATLTSRDILPYTNYIASFKLPYSSSSELKVQYVHDHAAFTMSIALKRSPEVELSATIGALSTAFGVEAKYKTSSSVFTKYNAGINVTKPDFDASIILADKGDLLTASYVHYLNQQKRIATVAEITRRFSTSENTFTVGGSCAVDHMTVVKARLNNHGKLGTFMQHEIRPKSYLIICGEVDAKALDKIPRIGLALALKL